MHEKYKLYTVNKNLSLIESLLENTSITSKKDIKNYIKHEMVYVNGIVCTIATKVLNLGDEVKIFFTKRNIPEFDLKILYEDKDLIAIDKPAGLLSISNAKEKEITAFRLVSDYIKKNNPKAKLFVVHRLDEMTSGVLLFSKNLKLKEELQRTWNDIVKTREYYCIVKGKMPKSGKIESYLTMNHFQIVHSTKNKEKGLLAITRYETIKFKNSYSLLRVEIDTGRRNQIRVHMSEADHPIVGDKKYGSKINPINRLALHASKLSLIDPRTNKKLTIISALPEEINALVK